MNRSVVLFCKKNEVQHEGKVVPLHTMEAQMEVDVWLYSFIIMAVDEWSASCPSHFMPRERTIVHIHQEGNFYLSLGSFLPLSVTCWGSLVPSGISFNILNKFIVCSELAACLTHIIFLDLIPVIIKNGKNFKLWLSLLSNFIQTPITAPSQVKILCTALCNTP